MLHRARSKDLAQPSITPGPCYMNQEQVADYLTELRSKRVARPNGSRPQPSMGIPGRSITPALSHDSLSSAKKPLNIPAAPAIVHARPMSDTKDQARILGIQSHRRAQSATSIASTSAGIGRPVVPTPHSGAAVRGFSSSTFRSDTYPSETYMESGQRWIERQEARALRNALRSMDLQEEHRLQSSAQDEASQLVWMHQNPDQDDDDKFLEIGKYNRGRSITRESGKGTTGPDMDKTSHGTAALESGRGQSESSITQDYNLPSESPPAPRDQATGELPPNKMLSSQNTTSKAPGQRGYEELAFSILPSKQSSSLRRSGSASRKASWEIGRGLFRNPNDQIYEEPDDIPAVPVKTATVDSSMPAPLRLKERNPLFKVQVARDPLPRANTAPLEEIKKFSRSEIHRNPPSQSRNPGYVSNSLPHISSNPAHSGLACDSKKSTAIPPRDDDLELRSEEIRAATSMRLKDRSPRLPTPTIVSNKPGRPIVSFAPNPASKDVLMEQENLLTAGHHEQGRQGRALPSVPTRHDTSQGANLTTTIPTINVSESPPIPAINLPEDPSTTYQAPSVSVTNAPSSHSPRGVATRPLRTPKPSSNRPLPHHSATAPATSNRAHWSPSIRRPTATCAQCALPIEGRIVSAASQRFHPECFVCFHCGEGLECVAFYPEPDNKRVERISRFQNRAKGEEVQGMEDQCSIEDGDEAPRFYCHLDFHEFYSPRCRSCKTPIEGEVVVACGGEWHVGHFFCAECGDPFDSSTPFVEKDGYAWCISCHTNRFSNKCKKCRRPVTDMVLKALGAEWHAQCFVCVECGDQFNDGRYFIRGDTDDPVCVKCEERRLKA